MGKPTEIRRTFPEMLTYKNAVGPRDWLIAMCADGWQAIAGSDGKLKRLCCDGADYAGHVYLKDLQDVQLDKHFWDAVAWLKSQRYALTN